MKPINQRTHLLWREVIKSRVETRFLRTTLHVNYNDKQHVRIDNYIEQHANHKLWQDNRHLINDVVEGLGPHSKA